MEGRHLAAVDVSSRSKNFPQSTLRERRLFMSSRVSDTLRDGTSEKLLQSGKDDDKHQEEFKSIYKEVQKFGMSQMSWKQRKAVEQRKAVALGAKPEKGHRMPIAMGLNIKRKREKLEAEKLQEDIALDVVSTKWSKMSKKAMIVERGLRASEGVFKAGVLYVKPLRAQESQTEEHSDAALGKRRRKVHKKGKKGRQNKKKRRKT